MGLKKKIELENGIIVNYHRVVSINKITNVSNLIEVASYTSKTKREEEANAIKNGEAMDVFINTEYFSVDYDADMNIENVYEYLKTTEKFENAEDA